MIIQAGVLRGWANDVQHFLLEHFDTIKNSPSHIYHSALPLCPSSSSLQMCYGTELLNEVKVVKGLPARWGACSRTVSFDSHPSALSCWNTILAVGFTSGNIVILNAITGSQEATLSGHNDSIRSIAFSSDGMFLASGGNDKTVKLWDIQTGGIAKVFSGHKNWVESVSISVGSVWVASGCWDKKIYLWNTQTGECHCTIEQKSMVGHVSFSHGDPQHLVSVSGNKVSHWDIHGHQIGPTYDGSHITFSLDGTQLALWDKSVITVQNFESKAVMAKFHVATGDIRDCCFSPDCKSVAAAAGSNVYLWNVANSDSSPGETFIGHSHQIIALAFVSPFSLISASKDKSLKFWEIGYSLTNLARANPKPIPYAVDKVLSVTLQVREGVAITSDSDGVVEIWDISTGSCKESFQTPAGDSPQRDIQLIDDKLIFVWHANKFIHTWDVRQNKPLLTADAPWPGFRDIKISGDGSRLFCLDSEYLQVWSSLTGEVMSQIRVGQSLPPEFLTVDGLRVWIHDHKSNCLGWDFGNPDLGPFCLPSTPSSKLHPSGSLLWDRISCRVWGMATKKVIFQLAAGFGKPADAQWGDQCLVICFESGEILILSFSHMFLQ